MVNNYFSMRAAADSNYRLWSYPTKPRIDFAYDTSSIASNIDDLISLFRTKINMLNLDIDIGVVAGYGLQWANPLLQVCRPDGTSVLYGPVSETDIDDIINECLSINNKPLDITIGTISGNRNDIPDIKNHPYLALETERRLLRNLGKINPDMIEHYIARGGYEALSNILENDITDEEIRKNITESGLAGRGGAFFPTGVKWGFLSSAKSEDKYLICNADEGDPGSWVNRIIMEGDPHTIIEGMIIAGLATKANNGYIYIRSEYPLAIKRMQNAIDNAYAFGILGKTVLDHNFVFNLKLIKGAGAYVCGEETGLIASIQDSRGMPRIKPPFPANSGIFFQPTNVNNVESFASIPMIIKNGTDWYKEIGIKAITGTKLFSISGDIKYAGIMELSWGIKISDILSVVGDIVNNNNFKALQAGGPLAGYLPGSIANKLSLIPDEFKKHGALIGSGGLVFVSDATCSIQMNLLFSQFVEDESCGRCTTCHGGNQRMTEIFRRISKGFGRREDRANLDIIGNTLLYSNCVHGQASPTIMKNTVSLFENEFESCVIGKTCTASVYSCPGLTKLFIVDQFDIKLMQAEDICPTNALIKNSQDKYEINLNDCIRCGACIEIAPNAIKTISDGNTYPTPNYIPRIFSVNHKNLIPLPTVITPENISTQVKVRGEKSLSGMINLK